MDRLLRFAREGLASSFDGTNIKTAFTTDGRQPHSIDDCRRGRAYPRGRVLCGQITIEEVADLLSSVRSPRVAVAAREADREGRGYSDYEEIAIKEEGLDVVIPLEILPDELKPFLAKLDQELRATLGVKSAWAP